jgi:WD40 repeat protein
MQVLSIPKKKRIHAIAFAPDGQALAAACGDGQLRLWDLTTGQVRQSTAIAEETQCGYDLVALDEGRFVFAGAELRIWEVWSNTWRVIPSHLRLRWGRQVRLSPDGRYLAEVDQASSTGWAGEGLMLYESADWRGLPALAQAANTTGGLAFSPDGQHFATGHIVRVGDQRRSSPFLPGGFIVPEYDYVVHVRELPAGRTVQSIAGWQQGVKALAFSPARTVLAGTAGPRLRVWDLAGNRELALHKRGTRHFQGLSFTADGRYLATVSNDETVRVWETGSWGEHTTFTWGIGKLLNIAFAPDGFRAAAGSDRGQVIIWDVDT